MDNTNKAIAKRINQELKARDWTQTELLREMIKFKYPKMSGTEIFAEVQKRKGNFSTYLKGNNDRSIPKEDLYFISKAFGLPLEYIWFGENKKEYYVPKGARYAAYQDNESEYRAYIANLQYEDYVQHPDEFGFNLFDYLGQFESINGYKFFIENYGLYFDYVQYGDLAYTNSDGNMQLCSYHDKQHSISDNLITTLTKHNETKMFRKIFFDNCSLRRFDSERAFSRNKTLFSDFFLETLLTKEEFFELILKTHELDINIFHKHYDKGSNRIFVEPMLYEALSYALKHEEDFKEQLLKMLSFVLEYSKSQYKFIKDYLKKNYDKSEYGDVRIDQYSPKFLRSSRNIPMGNVFRIREKLSDESLNDLIKEIEQCTFNMTHIINEQEKSNEEIKISTPDNSLFQELIKNAYEQNACFIPKVVHADKDFTFFQNYESISIDYESIEHLRFILDCLNKAQNLVTQKANKVLVHGDLTGTKLMVENGKTVGLAGWQKCHYGSKYDDRAALLSNVEFIYFGDEYIEKLKDVFDAISQDFNQEEKNKLIDKTINLLNEERKNALKEEKGNHSKSFRLKERSSKLEYFKELYLDK